jgi:hypothetical protein
MSGAPTSDGGDLSCCIAAVVGPISLLDAAADGTSTPLLGAAAAPTPLELWSIFRKRLIFSVSSRLVNFE